MSRRMSVAMTLDAVQAQTKTVTRRHVHTWKNLKPGDRLTLIEKGMGLPKGARQVVVAQVEVTDVRVEPVRLLTDDIRYGRQEVALEGLGHMEPDEFVSFWLGSHGPHRIPELAHCRRIEWRYLDEDGAT